MTGPNPAGRENVASSFVELLNDLEDMVVDIFCLGGTLPKEESSMLISLALLGSACRS